VNRTLGYEPRGRGFKSL